MRKARFGNELTHCAYCCEIPPRIDRRKNQRHADRGAVDKPFRSIVNTAIIKIALPIEFIYRGTRVKDNIRSAIYPLHMHLNYYCYYALLRQVPNCGQLPWATSP